MTWRHRSACLQGCPKPLGRAFAEPEFKTVDQLYKKPHLRFFDVNMGKMRAGELLASFELIELDYSFGEVTPRNLWTTTIPVVWPRATRSVSDQTKITGFCCSLSIFLVSPV